ncbi:MAG TPA: twin-arginine translocase TatA/TatE family subunit [Gemmatimonadaceae bacterium]|nr:twin-arginine translocase TatA/TatE family subunit [Gemmatimonadaceae bacterium]
MLGNLGMGEMIVALIIVLVLFGAKRIPEISASLGQGIREFKRNMADEVEPPAARDPSLARAAPPPASDRVPYGASSDERPEPKRLL